MRTERGKHNAQNRKWEKFSFRERKRDPAFREELIREWGLEKTPDSYDKALQRMYAELPDELVVTRRPLRRVFHGFAVAAAACFAIGLSLLGMNAVEPEFTESLPGLGNVFQALNGGEKIPPVVGDPDPEAPREESGLSSEPGDAGEFAPLPVEDNGVTLLSVEVIPQEDETSPELLSGQLCIQAEMPYMGRISQDLGCYGDTMALGGLAVISTETREGLRPSVIHSTADVPEEGLCRENGWNYMGPTQPQESVKWAWTFPLAEETGSEAVLTIYDAEYIGSWDIHDGDLSRPVLAEFTIDLASGRAKPTSRYLEKGLFRITPQECAEADHSVPFTNGWYVSEDMYNFYTISSDSEGNSCARVVLFGEDPEYRPVTLNLYQNEELIYTMRSQDPADMVTDMGETQPMGAGGSVYLNEYLPEGAGSWIWNGDGGLYAESVTCQDRAGGEYRRVVFGLPMPFLGLDRKALAPYYNEAGVFRLELADGETGEILIRDLYETYWEERKRRTETLGEDPDAEEKEGAVVSAPLESSPIPEPSPKPSPAPSPEPGESKVDPAVEEREGAVVSASPGNGPIPEPSPRPSPEPGESMGE